MRIIKLIFFMILVMPLMLLLSGCFDDSILDAIKSEKDFVAPYTVVLSNELPKRTTYFAISATGSETVVVTGDDASKRHLHRGIDLEVKDDYNDTGDNVVIDNVTGLMWTKCTATAFKTMDPDNTCAGSQITGDLSDAPQLMEWYKAAQTCKDLEYAGHKDWRLPRLPELLSIANYGFHPAIDPVIFPNNRGGDIEVQHYTRRYSLDDRARYMSNVNDDSTNPPFSQGNPNYTNAKYVKDGTKYVFNEGYRDKYRVKDDGTHVLVYLVYSDLTVESIGADRYKVTISGEEIEFTSSDRYNYDPVWGFGYLQNNEGMYLRIFIPNNEDTFYRDRIDYKSGVGPYVRVYVPDIRVTSWQWSDFWGDYIDSKDKYEIPRAKYKFDGTKFIRDDVNGKFIQKFDKPFGYWTYSSKLLFDENMNISDYGWAVFFQNGGTFGVNISSLKLKIKEDLTFEKQFVRCVRGGKGDIDDVDY